MKNNIIFALTSLLLIALPFIAFNQSTFVTESPPLKIKATEDLRPLVDNLINYYKDTHSEISNIEIIDLNNITEKNVVGIIREREINNLITKPALRMVIGREIIVPVISNKHPLAEILNKEGISRSALSNILESDKPIMWSQIVANGPQQKITILLPENSEDQKNIMEFLDIDRISKQNIDHNSGTSLISKLNSNSYPIGFCKLSEITSLDDQTIFESIRLLPIDKNNNKKLDYYENIYSDLSDFMRGVWIGKYPHQLVENIYAVSDNNPTGDAEVAFLNWLITDGQSTLSSSGFSELIANERAPKLEALAQPQIIHANSSQGFVLVKIVLGVFIAFAVFLFIGNMVTKRRKEGEQNIHYSIKDGQTIQASKLNLPKGLFYDKTHTWVYMNQNGSVSVGIDDFLQHVTGPFTGIKLKEPGEKVKKNESILTLVQDGKQLNIYAPVSGKITEINEELVTDPKTINNSPYSLGWIYKIEPSNWLREIQFMKMADKYRDWLNYEFTRLKDFIASTNKYHAPEMAPVIYQEGGELKDHVLFDMGPRTWEDFQKKFMDVSGLH